MASFNGGKYIREQIDSILAQLGAEDELVISDGGSSDDTVELIRRYRDPRVKLLQSDKRLPPIDNFEASLRAATGRFIVLADQDDVWLPGRVAAAVSALESVDMVVCDCVVVDAHGTVLHPSFFAVRKSGPGLVRNFLRNSYLGCCMAFTIEVRDRALPIPRSVGMHDIWLGMVAELFYRPVFLDTPFVKYRRHSGATSIVLRGSRLPWLTRIRLRSMLVLNLILVWTRTTFSGCS
jgi:glycosyltransferase involved in cell wall biosynthesis